LNTLRIKLGQDWKPPVSAAAPRGQAGSGDGD
jgi:hypothetical protein